jgi:serpin B
MFTSTISTPSTRFALKLFTELAKQEPNKNIFISPISVAFAMAMAYNGANGETRSAMAHALQFGDLDLETINDANAALTTTIEQIDPAITIAIANSLWARQGVEFAPEFLQHNQQFYRAEIATLDFRAPDTIRRINTWVDEQTRGKISKIIDQLDPLAVLVLLNAIYFKGNWSTAFDRKLTQDHPFTLPSKQQKQVPMMQRTDDWRFFWDGRLGAIRIPYGAGRVSMDVFLPEEQGGLERFYNELHEANWISWTRQFRRSKGTLLLPRFKIEYERRLNDALATLGMGVAFDRQNADFSAMTRVEQVSISQVKHKAFVEVHEEGTEAAAVTSVEFRALGMTVRDKTFRMVVDRPFFFVIRDQQTDTILFMGAVTEPR